jgi:hypothetical protein
MHNVDQRVGEAESADQSHGRRQAIARLGLPVDRQEYVHLSVIFAAVALTPRDRS